MYYCEHRMDDVSLVKMNGLTIESTVVVDDDDR